MGVQRENTGRGRSGNADHHPHREGVGPIRRIDNSNPEGYVGPDLGNSTRESYRRCGRLSVMKYLVQAARGGSDFHMGLTPKVNYRLAAQSNLQGCSLFSNLSRGGVLSIYSGGNGNRTTLIEVNPAFLGVYTSNVKVDEDTPQDSGGT
jgi:hypothetical protein